METETLKKIYSAKRERVDNNKKVIHGFKQTTFEQFCHWFDIDVFQKGCYYCGTTNERSYELYQLQRTNIRQDATRGGKRGKRLEIDRKNPSESYDKLDNIVWCCYWCNNAKSNFFTADEFKPIAKAIGEVLKSI